MHELAVCQSLLREVERAATALSARQVAEIVVAVGPLSGIEPVLLELAFTVARSGTIAEQAHLEVQAAPVIVWCESCQKETEKLANALLCGGCGGWKVVLRSGDELLLKRLVLTETEEPDILV